MIGMLLARLVEVSTAVAATRSRLEKRDLIADLLRETASAGGARRDRHRGVVPLRHAAPAPHRRGLARALRRAAPPADDRVRDAHRGRRARSRRSACCPGRGRPVPGASAVAGAVRPADGARAGLPAQPDHRQRAAGRARLGDARRDRGGRRPAGEGRPPRRHVQCSHRPDRGRRADLAASRALEEFSMLVGRPVRPMLAASAPDVAAGVEKVEGEFAVDTKLDGIRIQVHKHGDEVSVFTRSLEEISARLPEVVGGHPLPVGDRPDPRRRGDRPRRDRPAAAVPGDRVHDVDQGRCHRHPAVLLRPAAPRGRLADRGADPRTTRPARLRCARRASVSGGW